MKSKIKVQNTILKIALIQKIISLVYLSQIPSSLEKLLQQQAGKEFHPKSKVKALNNPSKKIKKH